MATTTGPEATRRTNHETNRGPAPAALKGPSMPKRSAILLAGRLLAGLAALPAAASADPVAAGTVAPLAAETAIPDPASVTGAAGLDDPVLSFGLARVADWSTARPFLDLARMMRPWIGHRPGQWGGMTYEEIRDGGYLDPDGWPLRLPPGLASIGTIWHGDRESDAARDRAGTYVLTYAGSGRIELGGDARVRSERAGRIVFETPTGGTIRLDITATDPRGTGDHIRDISILREEDLALHDAGAIFDPDWLALVAEARELRFMDWMHANNSAQADWADRPLVTDFTWATEDGVPLEIMVRLANETGTEPWFTIPHQATDDYIRAFATYVRDHLDPRLRVHVEYSNEAWNGAFRQFRWLRDRAVAAWGEETAFDYYAKRATETALIWEAVFGAGAEARLVNVIGGHTVNTWLSERLMDPVVWRTNEPGTYVDPATVFEALAITTYFGGATVRDETLRAGLLEAIADPAVDVAGFLRDRLADPGYPGSVPQIREAWIQQKAIADRHGLALVAYEGGQHLHHSFAVRGLTQDQVQTLTEVLTGFVRSPEMADLYGQLWDAWAEVGDGPFMQFTETEAPSRWGSWGLLSHPGDRNPRAELLRDRGRGTAPWFGDGPNPAFRQGVILTGGGAADLLVGTAEEDYLIGSAGDDVFVPGPGRDGISGGAGAADRLVLAGRAADYRLEPEGAGHRLTGPGGSKFVTGIEIVRFDDGEVTLEALAAAARP